MNRMSLKINTQKSMKERVKKSIKKCTKKISRIKTQKGFVILFTAVLSSIVLAISLGVASIALKEINFSTSAKDTSDAFLAADAGIECALLNDKAGANVFTQAGGGQMSCKGQNITLIGAYPSWSFVLAGLGENAKSCAKVRVNKLSSPVVEVISEGFNTGNTSCISTNPYRVERELKVTFNEVPSVQKDIYISGYFDTYNSVTSRYIAKISPSGVLDTSFTSRANGSQWIYTMNVQPDGKVIIGGDFNAYNYATANRIARLNSDGTLDTDFSSNIGTGPNSYVQALAIQSDGKIIVGGNFDSYSGVPKGRILRLNDDGILDTSFNSGGAGADSFIQQVLIQSDNKILIGGAFISYNGVQKGRIARLSSEGALDTSFNSGGVGANSYVTAMAIQSDGKIIIGGYFTSYNNTPVSRIARLNVDGTLDSSFNVGTGTDNYIVSIAIQPDGKIIIGGNFTSYNSTPVNRIVRLNDNGEIDTTFNVGTGANNMVYPIILH